MDKFMKKFFDEVPKEEQFMRKLKIVNDETLGNEINLNL